MAGEEANVSDPLHVLTEQFWDAVESCRDAGHTHFAQRCAHPDLKELIDAAYERGKREGRVEALRQARANEMECGTTNATLKRLDGLIGAEAESERKSVARGSGEKA